jgi:putative addiction module component (TIGR02574 family)
VVRLRSMANGASNDEHGARAVDQIRADIGARFSALTSDRATLPGVTDEASRILDAAMQLPEVERARLATLLRDSVGDGSTQEDLDAAVLAEVKRRLDNLDSGRTQAIPYEEIKRKLRATVERARSQRASTR